MATTEEGKRRALTGNDRSQAAKYGKSTTKFPIAPQQCAGACAFAS
jgi:hypothetical protein